MTIDAINSVDVEATASLVGRQACINNIVATVTRVEGEKAYTDRAGVVEVGAVGGCLMPQVGDVVMIHGSTVVWLETDLSARTPKGLVLEGDIVIPVAPDLGAIMPTGKSWDQRVCRALARIHIEHQEWRDRLNRDANEWANTLGLGDSFDRFMAEHGLTPRVKEFTVTWQLEIDATDHVAAAQEALRVQRDPESIATVYRVEADGDVDGGVSVDLMDHPSELTRSYRRRLMTPARRARVDTPGDAS